jgi:hypothetical protein
MAIPHADEVGLTDQTYADDRTQLQEMKCALSQLQPGQNVKSQRQEYFLRVTDY